MAASFLRGKELSTDCKFPGNLLRFENAVI